MMTTETTGQGPVHPFVHPFVPPFPPGAVPQAILGQLLHDFGARRVAFALLGALWRHQTAPPVPPYLRQDLGLGPPPLERPLWEHYR